MARRGWFFWTIAIGFGLPAGAVLLFVLYFFAWFRAGIFYAGDGTYRLGAGDATFQVEFPAVDLTRRGRSTFRFKRLAPKMGYVVALRVSGANDETFETPENRPNGKVLIHLRNEEGETVFRESRLLREWRWLRTRASISGESREVPIGGGSVTFERLNVGADEGWGTHFTPRFFGSYILEVVVEEPSTNAHGWTVHPVIEGYTALP